jgi:hypothetical protein
MRVRIALPAPTTTVASCWSLPKIPTPKLGFRTRFPRPIPIRRFALWVWTYPRWLVGVARYPFVVAPLTTEDADVLLISSHTSRIYLKSIPCNPISCRLTTSYTFRYILSRYIVGGWVWKWESAEDRREGQHWPPWAQCRLLTALGKQCELGLKPVPQLLEFRHQQIYRPWKVTVEECDRPVDPREVGVGKKCDSHGTSVGLNRSARGPRKV